MAVLWKLWWEYWEMHGGTWDNIRGVLGDAWQYWRQYFRRHKLPAPHLALWPTEVHVVVRRKVCEKGCYFGGIYPPPVAIGKMKVCM